MAKGNALFDFFAAKRRKSLSPTRIIALTFAAIILLGALLLTLPAASRSGVSCGFRPALFTATSATCVTGLVLYDTWSQWSAFGQIVILSLIEIGGLGFMSAASVFVFFLRKKVGLKQRLIMAQALSLNDMDGVVRLQKLVLTGSLAVEAIGALILTLRFWPEFGFRRALRWGVFHSVSAFCNAGFDIMGNRTGAFSSLTSFSNSLSVTLIVCALIVVGGIGFLTWDDVSTHGFRIRRYRMQSKAILLTTGLLILVPAAVLFFGEYRGFPLKERLCLALFQAVTPRTAGFNTGDLVSLSNGSKALILGLMLTGGAPGSTAGGMKVTTAAVLAASAMAVFRKRKSVRLLGRRVEDDVVRSAATLLCMYILLTVLGGLILSGAEKLPLGACIFESASALGTVGLSLGITPELGGLSRGVLILLMLWGRVGGLTLMFAALSQREREVSQCPVEKIAVG